MKTENNLQITKERVKAWRACTDGYRWFLEKFPQGGGFAEVYAELQADKKYDDSGWLADRVFAELDTIVKVQQTVLVSGADESKIQKAVADGAKGATTGDYANAATTGYRANAATTGYRANAATTGYRANAATTGDYANAATTGDYANAATTGDYANAATTGQHSVAASLGIESKAKASIGGAIVLVHRNDDGELLHIRASKVGENGVKPDTWYMLDELGEFVECEE